MRLTKLISVAVCLLSAGAAFGGPSATTKPAGPILEQIPAGSMGFIVVPDVRANAAQVDKFMEQIGQTSAYKSSEVKGLLEYICKEGKLGDGFNPDGGFAAVMLDMQQFGIDAATLLSGHDKNGDALKPPFVVIVPGASVDTVFAKYDRATPPGGKHVQVKLRMGEMFAAASNGYVMLSPNEEALDAAVQAKQNAAGELSADELKLIRSSALAMYVNMKVSGPMLMKVIKQSEDMMAAMKAMGGRGAGGVEAMQMNMMSALMPYIRQTVAQEESALVTVQFTDAGPTIRQRVTFVKDGDVAKSMAGARAIQTSMLSRLPNLDYIFALEAAAGEPTEERTKAMSDQMDKLLAEKFMADISEATRAKIKKSALDWSGQVQGVQLVFGGAPKDKGMVGFAMVLQCKDSAKVRALLAEDTDLLAEVVLKKLSGLMAPPDGTETSPPATPVPFAPPIAAGGDNAAPATTPATGPAAEPPVKVAYKKDATKAGATSVDAIVISSPQFADHQKELMKYIGDEQVRILVAAPTDKQVVITFGGAEDMMAAALKTATDNSGDIVGKEAQAILDQLPKQRTALALFNLTNEFKLIKQAAPENKSFPAFESQAPFAFTVNVADNVVEEFVLVPTPLIKDVVKAIQALIPSPVPPNGVGPAVPATKPHEDF